MDCGDIFAVIRFLGRVVFLRIFSLVAAFTCLYRLVNYGKKFSGRACLNTRAVGVFARDSMPVAFS